MVCDVNAAIAYIAIAIGIAIAISNKEMHKGFCWD